MDKQELVEIIKTCVVEERSKSDVSYIIKMLHNTDRKHIHHWGVEEEGNNIVVKLYSSLIGHSALERFLQVADNRKGTIRIYPYKEQTCIEITIPIKYAI